MGKSFEMMGLAAFNIFIAIILSSVFLTKGGSSSVNSLTESNIERFINDVTAISGGQRDDMDAYSVTDFLMTHIAENSNFKTEIEYGLPDMPSNMRTLEMDKMNFISHTLQGMKAMTRHESAVRIEYIKIADSGKSAKVMTTNYERGIMPVSDDFGEARMMPVTGTSYCEQELVLSGKNVIQMAGANCSTSIDFSDSY
ncbi:MAG: hypothetical protein H6867_11290 [Rhodospirillales bacterium]|nr:hypothetical protein [Rhodospirillales bacterium]MCB9996713.1 hypothetical protein [Rhodospirillales bacterium]